MKLILNFRVLRTKYNNPIERFPSSYETISEKFGSSIQWREKIVNINGKNIMYLQQDIEVIKIE